MHKQSKLGAWISLGDGLFRKGKTIYLRCRIRGRLTYRSTGTDDVGQARRWKREHEHQSWAAANGFATQRPAAGPGVTVNQVLDTYMAAGQPIVTRRGLRAKSPRSICGEAYLVPILRAFLGDRQAAALTLGDCDRYRDWRLAGGHVARYQLRGQAVQRQTFGGARSIDLELVVLSNALNLAVRRGTLAANPIRDRGRYADPAAVRHCREFAPTPASLPRILAWLEEHSLPAYANLTAYLSYSGLRLGEALAGGWRHVDWAEQLIHVQRSKKGILPFVAILPEMARLLRTMERAATGSLLFPSPFDAERPLSDSAYRRALTRACQQLKLPHVKPHGLRSYFVTQGRQSGLTDAEIAQLIGDRSGPALIAQVYGDVRPDHLLAVARKIQLTAQTRALARHD